MDFDLKKIIGTVAPALAGALGGPLANSAVSMLSQVILGKTGGTEQELAEVLAGGMKPETLLAIKQAEQNFKIEMRRMDTEDYKTEVTDRDSARNREVSLRDKITPTLAIMIIGGFLGMSMGVLFGKLGAESTLAGTVIGYLSAKAEQVASYYFGSSSGSARKTAVIEKALNKE